MSIEGLSQPAKKEAASQERSEEAPVPPGTAEILSEFKSVFEEGWHPPLSPEDRGNLHTTLHGIAERFDNQNMLIAYEEGRVPTLQSMNRAVSEVLLHLEPFKDEPEIIAICKLLSQRVKEIRNWCLRYEQTVIVFHRKLKKMRETGERDDAEMFKDADIERRRIHDNLMASIRSLDQSISSANEMEPLQHNIVRWQPGLSIPENFANEQSFIFSERAATHDNRDLIRDWAIIANLEQKMEALREYEDTQDSSQ